MNTPRLPFLLILALLVVGLTAAACAGASPQSDTERIATAYLNALSENDVETAMSYVADNATLMDPIGKFSGKDAFRTHLEQLDEVIFEVLEVRVEGNKAYYSSHFEGFGVNDNFDDGLVVVQDAKIVFDGAVGSWTLECRVNAAQAFCAQE